MRQVPTKKRQSKWEWQDKTARACIGSHTLLIDGSWLLPTKRLFRSAANFNFHDNRPKMADLKSVYRKYHSPKSQQKLCGDLKCCFLSLLQGWSTTRLTFDRQAGLNIQLFPDPGTSTLTSPVCVIRVTRPVFPSSCTCTQSSVKRATRDLRIPKSTIICAYQQTYTTYLGSIYRGYQEKLTR